MCRWRLSTLRGRRGLRTGGSRVGRCPAAGLCRGWGSRARRLISDWASAFGLGTYGAYPPTLLELGDAAPQTPCFRRTAVSQLLGSGLADVVWHGRC